MHASVHRPLLAYRHSFALSSSFIPMCFCNTLLCIPILTSSSSYLSHLPFLAPCSFPIFPSILQIFLLFLTSCFFLSLSFFSLGFLFPLSCLLAFPFIAFSYHPYSYLSVTFFSSSSPPILTHF